MKNYLYLEKDGALFRVARGSERVEVFHKGKGWVPYQGDPNDPIYRGDTITEAEAKLLEREIAGTPAAA
jgi:hypothetical protein